MLAHHAVTRRDVSNQRPFGRRDSNGSAEGRRAVPVFTKPDADPAPLGLELVAQDVETLTEVAVGCFMELMSSRAHLPDYPIAKRCEAMASALSELMCGPAQKVRSR